MASHIERRKFLAALGGAAVEWPLAAGAQQPGERMRRIGVLEETAEDDKERNSQFAKFREGLASFGWVEGRTSAATTETPRRPNGAGGGEELPNGAASLSACTPPSKGAAHCCYAQPKAEQAAAPVRPRTMAAHAPTA
jgi:hypothetical protein